MKYALDADHNLVPGDDLTFAYQGSGVATFIDGAGTGFRVAIGTRNLAEVDADGKVWLERGSMVEDDLDALDPTTDPDLYDDVTTPTRVGGYEDLFTNKQLRALCTEREIPVKGQLSKPKLAALLVEWDQTHPVEVEDAD